MFNAMENNELLTPHRILTGMVPQSELLQPHPNSIGYTPDAAALKVIANQITKLKERNPQIIYLLDRMILLFAGQCHILTAVQLL